MHRPLLHLAGMLEPLTETHCPMQARSNRRIVPESLGDLFDNDHDQEAHGYESSGGESSAADEDDVGGWDADEEDVDPAVQAEAVARAQEQHQKIEFQKARQRAQDSMVLHGTLA
jgi:hypothetical protein